MVIFLHCWFAFKSFHCQIHETNFVLKKYYPNLLISNYIQILFLFSFKILVFVNLTINLQMCCDDKFIITSCNASWPGSVHDSRVFRSSNLCAQFESGMWKSFVLLLKHCIFWHTLICIFCFLFLLFQLCIMATVVNSKIAFTKSKLNFNCNTAYVNTNSISMFLHHYIWPHFRCPGKTQ